MDVDVTVAQKKELKKEILSMLESISLKELYDIRAFIRSRIPN